MPCYKVILCDGDTETPLSMDIENAPVLGEPKKGDEWPVSIDGKQVYCEVIEIGEPKLDYDEYGNNILCQDLHVKLP